MRRAIYKLNNLLGLFCGILCILMAVSLAVSIFYRRILLSPIIEPSELNGYLLVGLAMLGAAYTLQEGGHVKIDLIYSRFSPRTQAILDLCTAIFALAYLFWLDWVVALSAWESLIKGTTTGQAFWPLFPGVVLLPIGTSLLILTFLLILANRWALLRKQKDAQK